MATPALPAAIALLGAPFLFWSLCAKGLKAGRMMYAESRRRIGKRMHPTPQHRSTSASASGKYAALTTYLMLARTPMVTLTFEEIAYLVRGLPGAALRAQWWANVRRPGSHYRHVDAWLKAGYVVAQVEDLTQMVIFRRMDPIPTCN